MVSARPNQIEPSLTSRVRAEELSVERVMVKRQTQHLVHPGLFLSPGSSNNTTAGRIVLQLTEVQDLIVRHHPKVRGGFQAQGTGRQAMIDDRQGTRLWYEVEVLSLTVNDQLKANEYLEFGQEASWKPKEVLTERIMTDLYRIVSSLVAASDDLMKMNLVNTPRQATATTSDGITHDATAKATTAHNDSDVGGDASHNKQGLGDGVNTTTGLGGNQKGSNNGGGGGGGVNTVKSTVSIQPPPQTFW